MSDLKSRFETAKAEVEQLSQRPGDDELLQLYSLFKQGTMGDVQGKRPGMMNFVKRAIVRRLLRATAGQGRIMLGAHAEYLRQRRGESWRPRSAADSLAGPPPACPLGPQAVLRLVFLPDSRVGDRWLLALGLVGPLTADAPLAASLEPGYLDWVERYGRWGASQAFSDGKRAGALTVLGHTWGRFVRMYILRLGFLDGGDGLVLSLLASYSVYLKYARLWELTLQEKAGRAP